MNSFKAVAAVLVLIFAVGPLDSAQMRPGNPQAPGQQKKQAIQPQRQVQLTEQQKQDQQTLQRRAWPERRANHWQYEHRTWQQRGGYQGYRIPDDYFRSNYKTDHGFIVYNLPFQYEGGNPRFQYAGYWFTMLDPYPESWGGIWYQTDELYVDYDSDGYYLFNRKYPGHPWAALSVTL